MASEKKKSKLKNAFGIGGILKNTKQKMRRFLFFTPSQRRLNNKFNKYEIL